MAKDISDAIQEAAKIAEKVPEYLREAAFNRALDAILDTNKPASNTSKRRVGKLGSSSDDSVEKYDDPAKTLLASLDRTAYPDVSKAPKVLERSLYLLRAARNDHDIDGLSAPQIAKILTEKFRIKTSRQAVTSALATADDKVDLKNTSNAVHYRLMQSGDNYLDAGVFGSAAKRPSSKKSRKAPEKKVAKASGDKTKSSGARAPKKGRPGPGAMLKTLAANGFFSEYRSIAEIQKHCEKKLAHNYSLQELSTPLRRAVHSGLLDRETNKEGQYEYRSTE